jgi:hypothetical protein
MYALFLLYGGIWLPVIPGVEIPLVLVEELGAHHQLPVHDFFGDVRSFCSGELVVFGLRQYPFPVLPKLVAFWVGHHELYLELELVF